MTRARSKISAAMLIAALTWLDLPMAGAAPASDGPVQGPALPDVDDELGDPSLPDLRDDGGDREDTMAIGGPREGADREREEADEEADEGDEDGGALEPPPPAMQEPEQIRVAVGLSSELDGSKAERALLDQLEAAVLASSSPRAEVRRLRVGAAAPREICREGRDDLVITLGYVPDEDLPVLLSYDCRIDEPLGTRRSEAAEDPALLGVLWDEHRDRVSNGARERRRARISPKVRTGLIAGAAVAVIGVAVGLLIAGAVRRDSVVLVVSP